MPVKAIVNLKNVISNANAVKARLPKSVKFCAVVKADAYGHGAEKVANAIYNIADCFAVATVEEGVKLRLSGIDKDVLTLTPAKEETARAINYFLTLTAGSFNDLKTYAREAKNMGVKVKVHLKFDTGMHRQGFDEDGLKKALDFCGKTSELRLCGVYSHFAMPENDIMRKSALEKFASAKRLVNAYRTKFPLRENVSLHISASGGFIKGDYFDMVRIGILLYGYTPFLTEKINVKPAMKITAPILSRRVLKRGESALYGLKRAEKDENIALIRYGYADGLFRLETPEQYNNRCMDITAVKNVNKGAKEVVVMGDAEKLARQYGTIPYEILVKCALRAEKIYIN